MAKLHVTQIGGYLRRHLDGVVNMDDHESHSDTEKKNQIFLTRALSALSVSLLTDEPMEDLCRYITDGFKDGGIDLIYFDANDRTLYLVQTKWHSDGKGSIDLGDTLKFLEGVRKVLEDDIGDLNKHIQERKLDIDRALYDANAKFVLVLAHTGQDGLGIEVEAAIRSYVEAQNDTSELMSLCVLKQADLHKAVAAGVSGAPISVEVQLMSWGQIREPHFGVYGQVCAADIAMWVDGHGSRLFDRNLRHFLARSTVNQDIVNTLVDRPEEFWYRNNGITAIATSVAKKPIGGNSTESGIFECDGFYVVNGAQTVGSIHAATTLNPDAVAKAMVPVRIISNAKSTAGFSSEVTRCTNTQNAIEKRDFVALDPEQERIRQELQIEGVHYSYKAGSAIGTAAPRFDLVEATVALACADPEVTMAVQAKREISKLWEDITKPPYKLLFNNGVNGPSVWQMVQALRAVDNELQSQTLKYSGRDRLICVHGNRFIQWAALRTLGLKVGDQFENVSADVPAIVLETVDKVITCVKASYADSYPASLFKNLGKCKALASEIV